MRRLGRLVRAAVAARAVRADGGEADTSAAVRRGGCHPALCMFCVHDI